jgi:hypothetical protein
MARGTHTKIITVALSPLAVAPGSSEQLFAVPGVKLGDWIGVNKPSTQPGLGLGGSRASANGQIGVSFTNDTANPITPTPGEVYTVLAVGSAGRCDEDFDGKDV